MTKTYELGIDTHVKGVVVGTFEADRPGEYTLVAVGPDGSTDSKKVLAIGPDNMFGGVGSMCASIPLTGALVVGAIVCGIVTFVRRSNARKQSMPPPQMPLPGSPPPPPPPGQV